MQLHSWATTRGFCPVLEQWRACKIDWNCSSSSRKARGIEFLAHIFFRYTPLSGQTNTFSKSISGRCQRPRTEFVRFFQENSSFFPGELLCLGMFLSPGKSLKVLEVLSLLESVWKSCNFVFLLQRSGIFVSPKNFVKVLEFIFLMESLGIYFFSWKVLESPRIVFSFKKSLKIMELIFCLNSLRMSWN